MMPTGRVKWFNKKKGYGFVDHEGKGIFIHHSEIVDTNLLENNDLISFDIVDGEKGLKAKKITKMG